MIFQRYIFLSILTIILTACGGGIETNSNLKTGVLLDSAVDGLIYKTESGSGITKDFGEFNFTEGEVIQFYLGKNLLGESKASNLLTPLDLIPEDKHSDTLLNILQLLQSLDEDDYPENGISISEEVQEYAKEAEINFSVSQKEFSGNGDILELLAKSGKYSGLVDPGRAALHFQMTLTKENIQSSVVSEVFSIGGLIAGLNGQLELSNYGIDSLVLSSSDDFQFNTKLPDNAFYDVTITKQPLDQTCRLINPKGMIKSTNVSSISINCQTIKDNLNGSVSGLDGSLILASDNSRYLISDNGGFSVLSDELSQNFNIEKQPENQQCRIEYVMFQGTIQYNIICIYDSVKLGGTVSGLLSNLTLKNSDGTLLYVSNNGSFIFPKEYVSGELYSLEIVKQPLGQNCIITNVSGNYSLSSFNQVKIQCENISYQLNVSIEGIGDELMPIYNYSNNFTKLATGTYQYEVTYEELYDVNFTSPVTKQCDLIGVANDKMPASNVNLLIKCSDIKFQYNITIDNFIDSFVLSNTGMLPISINSDIVFVDASYNTLFDFNVSTQPQGQTCSVDTIAASVITPLTEIKVSCQSEKHTALTTFKGLKAPIKIQNIITGEEFIGQAKDYRFAVEYGQTYDIRVINHPLDQSCDVLNSTGTVGLVDIDNIVVECIGTPYVIEVLINGLKGNIALINNTTDPISTSSTKIRFAPSFNELYNINIVGGNQPLGQVCKFNETTPTSGKITSKDIVNITLDCTDNQSDVIVTVKDLIGTSFDITGNIGSYVKSNPSQNTYQYKFSSNFYKTYSLELVQPAGQTCSYDVGSQSSQTILENPVSLNVSCKNNTLPIYINVTGLNGSLTIENTNFTGLGGSFQTSTDVIATINSKAYEQVSIKAIAPTGQLCKFKSTTTSRYDLSSMPETGLSNLNLECQDITHNVVVTVSDLYDLDLSIQNNTVIKTPIYTGIDSIYTFSYKPSQNSGYDLSIITSPATQICEFSANDISSDKLSSTSITSDIAINIQCENTVPATLPIKISDLKGQLTLKNSLSGFEFPISSSQNTSNGITNYDYSTYYYVDHLFSVATNGNPVGQTCSVENVSVESITKTVNNTITVSCIDDLYSVSGSINGLNLQDDMSIVISGKTITPSFTVNGDLTVTAYDFPTFAILNDVVDITVANTSQFCRFNNYADVTSLDYASPGDITADITCYNYNKLPINVSVSDPLIVVPPTFSLDINIDVYRHSQVSNLETLVNDNVVSNINDAINSGNEIPRQELLNFDSMAQLNTLSDLVEGELYHASIKNQDATLSCSISDPIGYMDRNGTVNVQVVCSDIPLVNDEFFTGMVIDAQLKACLLKESGGLKNVEEITTLICNQTDPVNPSLPNDVLELDGIELFQNLTSLTLNGYILGSLEPLRHAPSLNLVNAINLSSSSYVSLDDQFLTDNVNLDLLACIKTQYALNTTVDKIAKIDCKGSSISDVSGIELFRNLVVLNLQDNAIDDVTSISRLNILENSLPSYVKQLLLSDNIINNISTTYALPVYTLGLYQLRSLKILDLRYNQIMGFESLIMKNANNEYYLNNINLMDLLWVDADVLRPSTTEIDNTIIPFSLTSELSDFYSQSAVHDSSSGVSVMNDIRLASVSSDTSPRVNITGSGTFEMPIDISLDVVESRVYDRLDINFRFRPYNNAYTFSLESPSGYRVILENNYRNNTSAHVEPNYNFSNIEEKDKFLSLIGDRIDGGVWKLVIDVSQVNTDTAIDTRAHIDEWLLSY